MLATAYENGTLAGQLLVYALLTAIGFKLVRRLVRGSFGSGFRRSPAGTVLGLVGVGAVMIFSVAGSIGGDDMSRERANIVSGCTGGGQSASVCGCYADGLLEHTGHDRARFVAFEDKLKRDHDAGRPLPAHVLETAARCTAAGSDADASTS